MAQFKILVDSNVYFRLARNIHPLLGVPFGAKRYSLYLIEGFSKEYFYSGRLQSTFSWVKEQSYTENRKKKILISKKDRSQIEKALKFISEFAQEEDLTTGPVDNYRF